MINEIVRGVEAVKIITGLSDAGLCGIETLTDCNRAGKCSYCNVTGRWDIAKASTVSDGRRQIKWAYEEGCRGLNIAGGESLATSLRFSTKEDIPYAEHNTRLTKYAHELGMFTNITTNGDFVVPGNIDMIRGLKKAGLDMLTYTLHKLDDDASVRHIIDKAKLTSRMGIISPVTVVFTADRTSRIPEVAEMCVGEGIPFGTTIVQEIGKGYSAIPAKSQIPTTEQIREVFGRLVPLKRAGMITNSWKYLTEAPNYPNNSWKCNPSKDSFVHIRSQEKDGEIGVCSEVRTGFRTGEVTFESEKWKNRKLDLVEDCNGCRYRCTFESENSNFMDDLPNLAVMALIKSGHSELVQMWGKMVVALSPKIIPNPIETGKAYLGSIIDRASGKTAWREAMQRRGLGMWTYPSDERSYRLRAFSRVLSHAAPVYSALELLSPLSSRSLTVDGGYVEPSLASLPALAVDMSILWLVMSAQTDLLGYIGLKLLANAATHMAWDLGSAAVHKMRNFRSSATSMSV